MSILIFIVVLVVLILVHEFGHFIVAKKSGVRVDEFGIGFPPKAWGKKIGETEYTINWLPIGGFVRIWGEDPTQEHYEEGPGSERSFVKKPRYIQAAVLVAGVTMNVLLAYVLFVGAFMIGSPTAVEEGAALGNIRDVRLLVTSILPDSPAEKVLKPGDEIRGVTRGTDTLLESSDTLSPKAVSDFIGLQAGVPVIIDVVRRGEHLSLPVTPEAGLIAEEPNRIVTGFSLSRIGTESMSFPKAVVAAGERTYTGLIDIVVGLGTLVGQAVQGKGDMSQVTGPIGIVGLVGDAAALGTVWLMTFTAFISLNLAVINLLPIPALDGGRLLFVGIEAITRRPIKPAFANRVNQVGFIALLALMALVTIHDIVKIFS
ncbi:MAG: site-2 protease family protein [Candidatus Pacebacteria bacterium]|nr:site-2 protease family protein [Candidatus Paceibacterota bacterium]